MLRDNNEVFLTSGNKPLSSEEELKKIGREIIERVKMICCFGATNKAPNDLGVKKYIKLKSSNDTTPWTESELIGLPAALAVEKMFHENTQYFTKNTLSITESYAMAYSYGVANCEGMAACAYMEARKMGVYPIKYVCFSPTPSSHVNEELNCIIISKNDIQLIADPWDNVVCLWPASNNINEVPELSHCHGHSMKVKHYIRTQPSAIISYGKSQFDISKDAVRKANIELINLKASTYKSVAVESLQIRK